MRIAFIFAFALLAALPARAEPAQVSVKDLRQIKIGLSALMNGAEGKLRDGDRERAIREEYHFVSPGLDGAAAKNFVRVEAALEPVEKELIAVSRRICPTPDDCKIGEKDDAPAREKKTAALRQIEDEQEKAGAVHLSVDLVRITEEDLDKVTPRVPLAIRTVLWPLTRPTGKTN